MSQSNYTSTQKWTLVGTILASSLVFIDSTALNVALPALQQDLGVTGTQLLWVINGYALFLSALLLLGGALGDLYGRNRIFLIGLAIFTVSSLVCGLSQTPNQLIIARAFQGVGGALLTPGSLAILSAQFGDENRGAAIGIWSTFGALMGVIGPIVGGWLSEMGMWRVIFFLNIPLSIAVFYITLAKIPESKNPDAMRLDIWGSLWITLALAGISYGFIEAPNMGFDHPIIYSSLILGFGSLIAFVYVQRTSSHPMLPLSLFHSKTFTGGNLLTLFVYAALGGPLFFMPLNLIQIQGYQELEAGISMLPLIILIAAISPLMGSWVDKFGPRIPLIVGPFVTGVGFYAFTLIGVVQPDESYWNTFFLPFVLLGIGMGITVAPLTTAVMGAVSQKNVGIASGVNNSVARVASVLGVALLGATVLFSYQNQIQEAMAKMDVSAEFQEQIIAESVKFSAAQAPEGLSEWMTTAVNQMYRDSFIVSFDLAMWVGTFLCVLGGLMALFFIRSEKLKTSE